MFTFQPILVKRSPLVRVSDLFYFFADSDHRIRIKKIWIRIRRCKGNYKYFFTSSLKVTILRLLFFHLIFFLNIYFSSRFKVKILNFFILISFLEPDIIPPYLTFDRSHSLNVITDGVYLIVIHYECSIQ